MQTLLMTEPKIQSNSYPKNPTIITVYNNENT